MTKFKERIAHKELDEAHERIAELEAELASAKHLNAKWMDAQTTAIMDKEHAEAELAALEARATMNATEEA